ncbi:MAG: AraC family transcriptional regulator [Cyanobacteria bacterium]|nr:AraC family transcriptional regulator [Cyanobacteriota bacterium]
MTRSDAERATNITEQALAPPCDDQAKLFNPFLKHLERLETPEASRHLLEGALDVGEFEPVLQGGVPWLYQGANIYMGELPIVAYISGPAQGLIQASNDLTLVLGYGGEKRVRQRGVLWTCRENTCLLLAAKASWSFENSLASNVVFRIDVETLKRSAMAMGGWREAPPQWQELMDQAHGWQIPAEAQGQSMQVFLRQVMAISNDLLGFSQTLLDRMHLEDQIYRLVAAMLIPELRQESPHNRLRQRQEHGRDAFDELIDYILANLGEPLNLTNLENHSHYSRRTLQYVFRDRFACTPSQWIRKQRLEMAHHRLQNPQPRDSVSEVAFACGYRSMSLFSLDFQQHYHIKPSHLLREGLRRVP